MLSGQLIEHVLLAASVMLLLSLIAVKISGRFSIPALVIFLAIGMLAGSEGLGGIYFDNARLANSLGVVALCLILFFGALDTHYETIRTVFFRGFLLSTLGVFLTTATVGLFAVWLLDLQVVQGLLLGAIVSSTDAAAVFSVLRTRNISLKKPLKPLLEFESGSNDPMAVFLTVTLIELVKNPGMEWLQLTGIFAREMILGFIAGIAGARLIVYIINRIRLEYEGLYPVLTVGLVIFVYSVTEALGGNGFLAVYLTGLGLARKSFFFKKALLHFHEALAWLLQIAMFLTLGLLVFPSHLVPVMLPGLAIAAVLCFIARPLSVLLCLSFSKMRINERLMISWVGLRGAAPIVLATFPLLAGVHNAEIFFNIVFFVVLTSVLFQGTTIPWVSKILKVNAPLQKRNRSPIEFEHREGLDADLLEFIVPYKGKIVGKALLELSLPADSLAVLVCRGDKFLVAKGATQLEAGDVVMILVKETDRETVKSIFNAVDTLT